MHAICYQIRPEVIEMLINKGARLDVIITKLFQFKCGRLSDSRNSVIYAPFTMMSLALRSAYCIDKKDMRLYSTRYILRNKNWKVLLKYGVKLDPVRYVLNIMHSSLMQI